MDVLSKGSLKVMQVPPRPFQMRVEPTWGFIFVVFQTRSALDFASTHTHTRTATALAALCESHRC